MSVAHSPVIYSFYYCLVNKFTYGVFWWFVIVLILKSML